MKSMVGRRMAKISTSKYSQKEITGWLGQATTYIFVKHMPHVHDISYFLKSVQKYCKILAFRS